MRKKKTPLINSELDRLLTEQPNPASSDIDLCDTQEILQRINREDRRVARAVQKEIPKISVAVHWIVESFQQKGRLILIGAGTSGRLAVLEASECPPTFNVSPRMIIAVMAGGKKAFTQSLEGAEDQENSGRQALRRLKITPRDLLIGIAASGRTPFVLGAMKWGKKIGTRVVSLTASPDSTMEKWADLIICPATGPEVVTGSTRMKAGTAQKMVLNMLTTAAMIRMGYVYSNLMINLQPNNEKLRDRRCRIVSQLTSTPKAQAALALTRARGNIKAAILMLHYHESPPQARQRLKQAGQNLRLALKETQERTLLQTGDQILKAGDRNPKAKKSGSEGHKTKFKPSI
jgi:N-acetylmuramic acid 6-phosphate etherase